MIPDHPCVHEGQVLDGDYVACVDGTVFGTCGEGCSGVCERLAICTCLCHHKRIEIKAYLRLDVDVVVHCPICERTIEGLHPVNEFYETGKPRDICTRRSEVFRAYIAKPCGHWMHIGQWYLHGRDDEQQRMVLEFLPTST